MAHGTNQFSIQPSTPYDVFRHHRSVALLRASHAADRFRTVNKVRSLKSRARTVVDVEW